MSPTDNATTDLVADALKNDPRIAEAKRLVGEAISEHAAKLSVCSATESLQDSFAQWIDRLTAVGMTWWIDSLDDPTILFEQHRERVLAGPPTDPTRPIP